MRTADQDLLARLDALYGRAFLRRLVQMGETARRLHRPDEPAPEILATVRIGGTNGPPVGTAATTVRGIDNARPRTLEGTEPLTATSE